ncbi:metallophosphoesterase [Stenotrophomonas sp. S41]|uniref:metallophosphoesterase family protein n=1 Tax=Stenotrophomonas sp. S41 TaxID=2767464 RepID=UPI00190AAC74|nr:metallophosphoesterase [Stenotrophomonas sp. S41]MBK0012817.1 metallophosphoesterase [Stenotrophomonas sp. S41]
MAKAFVHLSDLHYTAGKSESYGVVLRALFDDLAQVLGGNTAERYLILSGDVVKAGSLREDYNEFKGIALENLARIGIEKTRIICVPGNHDVDRELLKSSLMEHEGVVSLCKSEDVFVEYVRGKKDFITTKFGNYLGFEESFSNYGVGPGALGQGHELSKRLGVFCLNTAYFSAGGSLGISGSINDFGRLVVDTRGLHSWIQNSKFETRILVMHHPLEWLCDWSAKEVGALLGKDIDLLITGHTHEQDIFLKSNGVGQHVHSLAPALFTRKSESLGYSIIHLDNSDKLDRVEYRQWVAKSQIFVSGTSLSSTNDGFVRFHLKSEAPQFSGIEKRGATSSDLLTEKSTLKVLLERFERSIQQFDGQPPIFVEPILSEFSESIGASSEKVKPTFGLAHLLDGPFPIAVNAPPQFGLTCLARKLCLEFWRCQGRVWIYLDANSVRPHRKAIVEAVQSELDALGVSMALVHGVVIDSVRSSEKDCSKLIEKFSEHYPVMDLIIMRSNDGSGGAATSEVAGNEIRDVFLWSMARSSIRSMVSQYNDIRQLGDEDVVTARLAQDLEAMNIHRTPLNCVTLLKASEVQHEDSPVNRAELIKRVLFAIFNSDGVPTYKSRPDVKDCEFVLGFFCERIVRTAKLEFRREEFKSSISSFCNENLIDIDSEWVFDVLVRNNIIVATGYYFKFKFVYWVMYFAAQRMCQSDEFKDFIFQDQRYSAYPEIIEFYTGTNRSMNDAIKVLGQDLRRSIVEFDRKIALPDGFDLFSAAQWSPSTHAIEQMKAETINGVERSNLPDSVKDQYSDRSYDRTKPYAQELGELLDGYSYNKMLQAMRAAAKALRNSDYVDTNLKKSLLSEILAVWERVATVILVLIPVLAKDGEAVFEDVRYVLEGKYPENISDRFMAVLQVIPSNISGYYQDDLFSSKMSPLITREISSSRSNLAKHLLVHVIVKNRPRGWSAVVRDYIGSLPKNSFYLLDIYKALRGQYRFGYLSSAGISEMESLIQMCAVKHVTGAKELGTNKLKSLSGKVTMVDGDVVPKRMVDESGNLIRELESSE